MVDVLHHIESSVTFLQEVRRVLQPNGRLIFCEPAITSAGYHLFHKEPVDMSVDPLAALTVDPNKRPGFDSGNSSLAGWPVSRRAGPLCLGTLLERVDRFAFAVYPLLPEMLARRLLRLEWLSRGLSGRLFAFRLLAGGRRAVRASISGRRTALQIRGFEWPASPRARRRFTCPARKLTPT
jgi:SAM-dependent methyltransferase